MEFLNQCELLKIEDILPFFQDFVTIDHFKVRIHFHYVQHTSLDCNNRHACKNDKTDSTFTLIKTAPKIIVIVILTNADMGIII